MDTSTTAASTPADYNAPRVFDPAPPYSDTASLAPRDGERVGAFICRLIELGLANDAIAPLARAHYPDRKTTSEKSVQAYRYAIFRRANGIWRRQRKSSRSRVGNGRVLLPNVDGRSPWVRRAKELIIDQTQDLGGVDALSAAERAIVRRCAVLIVELERRERQFALSEGASDDQLDTYSRAAGNLRRMLEALGLERRARDVTPSLAEILRETR